MGCPGGHSLSALFGQKENFNVYFSGKWRSLLHASSAHYNRFLGKLKEKLARKARVNIERVYPIVLMPLGHPIIVLESNKFNMVAVSVKKSIGKDRNVMVNLVLGEYMRKMFCQSVTLAARLPIGAASVTF